MDQGDDEKYYTNDHQRQNLWSDHIKCERPDDQKQHDRVAPQAPQLLDAQAIDIGKSFHNHLKSPKRMVRSRASMAISSPSAKGGTTTW